MESRLRERTCDCKLLCGCCGCKDPPPGEFKKVIDLRSSGLEIYIHKNIKEQKASGTNKYSFVLHNTGNKELKRPDYIFEMCQYKTQCMKCKRLASKVHSLMVRIEDIQKNQILGVCDYCGCKNKSVNCKRCEYIINKFVSHKDEVNQSKTVRHLTWINKMYSVLQDFLDRKSSCRHEKYRDPELVIEEIIRQLKRIETLEHRESRPSQFPSIQKIQSSSREIPHNVDEPEKLMEVIKAYQPKFDTAVNSSEVKLSKTVGCLCKYLTDKISTNFFYDEYISQARKLRRYRSDENIPNRDWSKIVSRKEIYIRESPQEKHFNSDISEAEKPDKAVDKNVSISNTLKERSDNFLAYAKKARETRKIQGKKILDKGKTVQSPFKKSVSKIKRATEDVTEDKISKNIDDKISSSICKLRKTETDYSLKTKDSALKTKSMKKKSEDIFKNKQDTVNNNATKKDYSKKAKSTKEKLKYILGYKQDKKENITEPPISSGTIPELKTKFSQKEKKRQLTSSHKMFLNLLKETSKSCISRRAEAEKVINENPIKLAPIHSLPKIRKLRSKQSTVLDLNEEVPETILECDNTYSKLTPEKIRGSDIVPNDSRYKDNSIEEPSLLFKIVTSFDDEIQPFFPKLNTSQPVKTSSDITVKKPSPRFSSQSTIEPGGILRYALSDQMFIKKGLTVLPTSKTMRIMNIYKMKLANIDWFKYNEKKKVMFYDTGEKLAEIYANRNGRWFYKNGKVALDYYTATEQNVSRRYIIYSSGLETDNGRPLPITVLACFDHLGNGVVYDHYGSVRLKYNQSEGILVDTKIGAPSKWKWHTLNDPPVLQSIFLDTHLKDKDPFLEKLIHKTENKIKKSDDFSEFKMLKVEFENHAKEKAEKRRQEFQPFEIRMKAVKINEQFSLRVVEQSNVYLIFQVVPVSLKLNLGMQLINTEIVDVETAEISEVTTPYDRFPPRSQSVADIQEMLQKARDFKENGIRRTKGCKLRKILTMTQD